MSPLRSVAFQPIGKIFPMIRQRKPGKILRSCMVSRTRVLADSNSPFWIADQIGSREEYERLVDSKFSSGKRWLERNDSVFGCSSTLRIMTVLDYWAVHPISVICLNAFPGIGKSVRPFHNKPLAKN